MKTKDIEGLLQVCWCALKEDERLIDDAKQAINKAIVTIANAGVYSPVQCLAELRETVRIIGKVRHVKTNSERMAALVKLAHDTFESRCQRCGDSNKECEHTCTGAFLGDCDVHGPGCTQLEDEGEE